MDEPRESLVAGRVAVLGAGRMAAALVNGFVAAGKLRAGQVVASDPSAEARDRFAEAIPQAAVTADNRETLAGAAVALLAVKPQHLDSLLDEIADAVSPDTLLVSIAAGAPLSRLAARLPHGARLVRVMPNTPALIGRGASAFSLGEHATPDDGRLVAGLMGAVGYAAAVAEPLLDAVTGLSGSGPAFVYTVVEALADAGVRAGLPRAVALELAARTTAGAAEMVSATGRHPATLRDEVTSPGGTTAAGLAELERLGLPWALHAAVEAATQRARELGAD